MTATPGSELEVIDSHVMLASELSIPRAFIEDEAESVYHRLTCHGAKTSRKRIHDQVLALYQDDQADRLVKEMDAARVAEAFLIAPDFSHAAECALTRPEVAHLHHQVVRRHAGRFRVFWGVDPRSGSDGLELFERCVRDYGFAGMKLHPLAGYSPSDPELYPYYELCAAYRLPVLVHTGPGWAPLDFSYGQPLLCDQATRDFPHVNFILGHGGITYVEESSYLCGHRPNVYLDISQFPAVLSPDGWQSHLNRLFRSGINHKILFGTCWPSFRISVTLPALVREFRAGDTVFAGVNASSRRLIMAGNSRRLTGERAVTAVGAQA